MRRDELSIEDRAFAARFPADRRAMLLAIGKSRAVPSGGEAEWDRYHALCDDHLVEPLGLGMCRVTAFGRRILKATSRRARKAAS